jgi:hypothetical protein
MVQQKISKYTFSLVLLVLSINLMAQKNDWYSISIGGDLSRLALPFIDTTRYGWEASGNVELLKDLFAVVEIGSQSTQFDKAFYSYQSAGAYTRIGVDYNFMKHLDVTSTDKMFIGLRYGFTTFFHEANNIEIPSAIWGDAIDGKTERKWMGANWVEVGSGMRARIINNFYLGWSIRYKLMLWSGSDTHLAIYHIPGFGRGESSSSVGVNYSLYYKIPLMKKSVLSKLWPHKKDAPESEASPQEK